MPTATRCFGNTTDVSGPTGPHPVTGTYLMERQMRDRIKFIIYEWQQRGGTAHQLTNSIMDVIEPRSPQPKWTKAEADRLSKLSHADRLAEKLS